MKNTKRHTTSPVDFWGTPEHEAAMDRLTEGHICRDIKAGRECSHVKSDEWVANYQRMIYNGGWNR